MKEVNKSPLSKGHYYQVETIGPFVIATCSCGWSVRKIKQHSVYVTKAAREHWAKNRPKNADVPRTTVYNGKEVREPTSDEVRKAYKQVYWPTNADEHNTVHGGNLRQNTPRKEKHQRNWNGVRVK